MHRRKLILLPVLLALCLTPLTFADGKGGGGGGAGGGGGGGSGGGGQPTNELVGEWVGGQLPTGGPIHYLFQFNKDFTYTLLETDSFTGEPLAFFAGTYTLGAEDADGFPVLTMVANGEIILQAGVEPAFESLWLRVSPSFVLEIGRLD
jgi:hypothetical protein